MPKVIPNDMPKVSSPEAMAKQFYEILMMSPNPHKEVRPFMANLQQTCCTRDVQQILKLAYQHLCNGGMDSVAEYLKELYGYGTTKKCFEREARDEESNPKAEAAKEVAEQPESKSAPVVMITLDKVEDYCLNQCFDYDEVHAIYNMLLELFFANNTPEWISVKGKIQKRMQDLKKGVLKVEVGDGGEFIMEKKVEYEVGHVEAGGTGVNINKGGKK